MPIRASRVFPELLHFSTDKERKAALRKAYRPVILGPRYWLYVILAVGASQILGKVIVDYLRLLGVSSRWINPGLVAGGIMGGLASTGIYVFRRGIARSLRQQLRERGILLCLQCGYDLRGLSECRCPECGESFDRLIG